MIVIPDVLRKAKIDRNSSEAKKSIKHTFEISFPFSETRRRNI